MAAKKKATSKKTPVKKTAAEVVPFDIEADVGAGFEGADRDSYAIPFLRILQKLSPQCDEASGEYIKGAKAGMFFNSVTNEVIEGPVTFLPCAFQRRFILWGPRSGDGGYKGDFLPEEVSKMRAEGAIVDMDGRLYAPLDDGSVNEKKCDRYTDTRSHFGLLVSEDGTATQVLLALSSTQIKKSKQLMSIISQVKVKTAKGLVTPPSWLNKLSLSTVLESNDEGSWHGVRIEADGFITDMGLYDTGKAFHESIAAGEAKVAYEHADDTPKSDGKF